MDYYSRYSVPDPLQAENQLLSLASSGIETARTFVVLDENVKADDADFGPNFNKLKRWVAILWFLGEGNLQTPSLERREEMEDELAVHFRLARGPTRLTSGEVCTITFYDGDYALSTSHLIKSGSWQGIVDQLISTKI